ncbi:MAG TPA: hypothetical protein PLI43_18085 [Albidovulum sp.]|uniref:hypothetical protein n=1 Tax=Albidovulum sp. TaxID=1872424 RepID=UPI002BCD2386|nr:hypothetical protein [Albidovulum sp.]
MSDPLSNSEIQDVLSSIRRLVSEDRRARESRAPESPAAEAVIGKLILTEAHRVEIVEETLIETVETDPSEIPAMAPVEQASAEPGINNSIRPASVLADDLASLESTIAELEAAVAGIGSEFEPDGSEVGPAPNDTATRQLEDAFDDGFIVDIGGPVRVGPAAEDKLDEPVAGSAAASTVPEVKDAEPTAEDSVRAPDEIAFLRSASGARRPDWQVISGGESMSAAGSGLTGRLHLRPAETAEPEPAGAGDDEEFGDVTEDAVLADDTVEKAEVMPVDEAVAEAAVAEESALDIPVDPDVEVAVAWEMMADAVPAVVEEAEAVALVEEQESALAEEVAAVGIPADLETPLMAAAAGLGGAMADPTDEAEEDGLDLFASGDEAVIDMEMLRELIVQVLREELQGPLGERITRNVRKLVRQEIARALESSKFE